jgi:hypothetical protein
MNLLEALNNENSDELQKRIRLLDVSARDCPKRKADRVEYLRGYLLSTGLHFQIAQMSEAEQTMVADVVHNQSGYVDEARLLARYGSIPSGYLQAQPGYWSQWYGQSKPKSVKSLLGLIFYRQCIPVELRDRLKKLLPRPEQDRVTVTGSDALPTTVEGSSDSGELPVYRRNMELAAHQDLYTVLRLIDQGGISVSEKTHVASAASMNRISAELYEGDFFAEDDEDMDDVYRDKLSPMRAYAWPLIVQAGGLAKRTGNKLQLSAKGRKVLQRKIPFEVAIAALYQSWRDKGKIDEFRRINRIKGQTRRGRGHKGSGMTPPQERRHALEFQLQSGPAGEWMQVDEWFRLNALGAFSLEMADEYRLQVPKMPPLLQATDELEFMLLRTPEPHERILLEQFATISKDHLRLDAVRALLDIEQGGALVDLISLLRQQADSKLPVEVEDLLDDLKTRTTSIRDAGGARIIECASEALARLVAESVETGKYCFYAGGGRIVVMENSWRNFRNGLRKVGYVLSADTSLV